MSEYWLISAPGDKTCQQTWETLHNTTFSQHQLSMNYKFPIPDLKVGTLDQLVGLSDDLGKLDVFVEQVTRKVAQYLGEVLEDNRDKLHENLMANNNNNNNMPALSNSWFVLFGCACQKCVTLMSATSCRHEISGKLPEARPQFGLLEALTSRQSFLADLPGYITHFQWDIAKYPIKQSLRNIADIISKQVGQIDADLKTKSTAYNNLKGNLQNLEKKQTGSLVTRNLADLVQKQHFILDSEYLTTILVIVPKPMYNEWNTQYEKLSDMVVPRSSQMIVQDNEHGLFTVTLFKKAVDEFKLHARERKFIVREFTYNEEELAAGKNEITKLVTDKKKQFGPLVRWLKVNFSECFCAWIHVKALRVFVESVLRYGLPVNFQAMLLHPNKKTAKRLRDVLNQLYGHLDSSALQGSSNVDGVDIPGLGFGQSEYYPYVYYKINIDMIESKV